MCALRGLPRQFLLALTVKSVKIMTVKNSRNPPIWTAFYCYTLGDLGTVLGTVLMEGETISVAE